MVPLGFVFITALAQVSFFTTETSAVAYSFICAAIVWILFGVLYCRSRQVDLFLAISVLAVFRIIASLLHFYYIFAPLAQISNSSELPYCDFLGDLAPVHLAGSLFVDEQVNQGLIYAIFGDYYRGINNPGVAVLYGILFTGFGEYGAVAVPWTVLVSGFGSIVAAQIALRGKLGEKLVRFVGLGTFLMPQFFIFPVLYRDNYIIFLLLLTAYTVLCSNAAPMYFIAALLILESLLLGALRSVYILVPSAYLFVKIGLDSLSNRRVTITGTLTGCAVAVLLLIAAGNSLDDRLQAYSTALVTGVKGDVSFTILSGFKAAGPLVYFPAAFIVALLAPMPWWQDVPGAQLAFQVFACGQSFMGIAVLIAAVVTLWRRLHRDLMPVLGFFVVIESMALFGESTLGGSYFQIAMPFLLIFSARWLFDNRGKAIAASGAVFVALHLLLLTR